MIRQLTLLLSVIFILSCSATKSGGKVCYRNTRSKLSIQWTEKIVVLNYLKLRKGNYFQYYQKFPLIVLGTSTSKLLEYQGIYTQQGDTITLHFCSDTIPKPMTEKILIDTAQKQLTFLLGNPKLNQHFSIKIRQR